jgi:hypothetical protein
MTDRRDAEHLLDLLRQDRFPRLRVKPRAFRQLDRRPEGLRHANPATGELKRAQRSAAP